MTAVERIELFDYFRSNYEHLKELIVPLKLQRDLAFNIYGEEFHNIIDNQYDNLLMSVIGIEVCKNVGVSVETYYEFIGDSDLHNLFMEIGI